MKNHEGSVMNKLGDISLRIKVPVLFAVLLLCLVGIPCFLMYKYYYDTFSNTLDKSLESAVDANAEEVSNLINSIVAGIGVVNDNENAYIANDTSTMSGIGRFLLSEEKKDQIGYLWELQLQLLDNKNNFNGIFEVIFKTKSTEIDYALIVEQEYMISKYLPMMKGDRISSGNSFYSGKGMEQEWYHQTIKMDGGIFWFGVDYDQEKLYLAKLLKYKDFRKAEYKVKDLGVILLGFDLSWIEDRINTNELTEGTTVYLVDNSGKVLYTVGSERHVAETDLTGLLKEMVSGERIYRNYEGVSYLVRKDDVGQGLNMLTLIPRYDVQKMTAQMVKIILIVMVTIIGLGILLVSLLSRYMLKPIIDLSWQMESGRMEPINEELGRKDEIGLLYLGYNQMQEKIQELLKETWDSAQRQKKVEVRALQAQINPHFILNTLSSVGCAALLCGQDQIASQLTTLSSIIHYNVRNPYALVSLREEIGIIQKYEEIQKINYSDIFQIHYVIASDCEEILVPKMIIQPLVENAIVHTKTVSGCRKITVVARMQDMKTLVIIVADSGKGADVDRINRYLRGECELDTARDSFGVRNVYERLRLIFGENGDLNYRTDLEGYTEAVITIKEGV